MLKPVYFLRPYTLYNSGEIAGFPEAEAAELIKSGVARAARSYATLEELEAEVAAAGYKGKAVKSIAKERFEGVHGEEARYLAPEESEAVDPDDVASPGAASAPDDVASPAAVSAVDPSASSAEPVQE
jgi:hypothetical protein